MNFKIYALDENGLPLKGGALLVPSGGTTMRYPLANGTGSIPIGTSLRNAKLEDTSLNNFKSYNSDSSSVIKPLGGGKMLTLAADELGFFTVTSRPPKFFDRGIVRIGILVGVIVIARRFLKGRKK